MKKIIFSLFIMTSLFGIELKSISNIVDIFKVEDNKPKWVVDYKKGESLQSKSDIYFIGVSRHYLNNVNGEKLAKKEAFEDGYKQISEYFGVYIKSTLKIDKELYGNQATQNISKNTKAQSSALLFDIAPEKIFIEHDDDSIVVYVLFKLDANTRQKIQSQIKKDREKYAKLKAKIIKAINNKNLYQAKNFLALAKSTRSAYTDEGLKLLEQRIKHLQSLPKASISLPKQFFVKNEELNIDVSVDNGSFIYVFYGNEYLKELFPNEYSDESNYLYKNNDIEIDTKAKNASLIVVASLKRLVFGKKENTIDGYNIYQRKYIMKVLDRCLSQAYCTKTMQKIKIKNLLINAKLILKTTPELQKEIKTYLFKNGIRLNPKSKYKLVFKITQKKKYSSYLGTYLISYELKTGNKSYELNKEGLFSKIKELIFLDNKL